MKARSKHCDECPFRKGALKGYLGPYETPADLHRQVMEGEYFACHKTHPTKNATFEEIKDGTLPLCAGAMAYMKKNCKRPYDKDLLNIMNATTQEVIDDTMSAPEMMEYHKQLEPMKKPSVIKILPTTVRTLEEIERQIAGLLAMRERLPERSAFGDENWVTIDYQIKVLKGETKADYQYIDEDYKDYQDGDNDLFYELQRAEEWLVGREKDDLFDE